VRVLVLGASGMLGSAILRVMSERAGWTVYGTLRSDNRAIRLLAPSAHLLCQINVEKGDSLLEAFMLSRPEVVVNCVGLVKQMADGENPLEAIPLNSLLPHRLAKMCELVRARLIHISTDCVFSGRKGNYSEGEIPDATDIYGRSKLLGEVDYPHAITLRTSIIGHELASSRSLIGWFLAQQGYITGYAKAIFSGLPTYELARLICDFVVPHPALHGVYHVGAKPISKYDLLQLVRHEYGKDLQINQDDMVEIDRSLDSSRFFGATGYIAPTWRDLITQMQKFR
jgi:dTDP-4-dehydrorhamnose reductase